MAPEARAQVVDGRTPHVVLLEIFTDEGVGTEIVRSKSEGRDAKK